MNYFFCLSILFDNFLTRYYIELFRTHISVKLASGQMLCLVKNSNIFFTTLQRSRNFKKKSKILKIFEPSTSFEANSDCPCWQLEIEFAPGPQFNRSGDVWEWLTLLEDREKECACVHLCVHGCACVCVCACVCECAWVWVHACKRAREVERPRFKKITILIFRPSGPKDHLLENASHTSNCFSLFWAFVIYRSDIEKSCCEHIQYRIRLKLDQYNPGYRLGF